MEEIISKINQWRRGEKASPSVLQFNLLDGCNQNCKFCEVPYEHTIKKRLLSDKDYYRIIKEAAKINVNEIRLCGGGEPLLKRKRAMKVISLIKKYKMTCRLITNGTLFKNRDIKKLVKLGIDDIQFSIMGPDAKTHDYLVGLPGAFNKVIKNIKLFNKWKKKLNKNTPFLSFYFILNKLNYKELNKFHDILSNLGIGRFGVYDLDMRSEGCKELKLDKNKKTSIKKSIKTLKKLIECYGIDFYFQETILKDYKKNKNKIQNLLKIKKFKYDLLNVPCYEPWYYLGIRGDGLIEICPNINYPSFNIRNKSLKETWYGKHMDAIRDKILKKQIKGNCLFCCTIETTIPIQKALKKYPKGK